MTVMLAHTRNRVKTGKAAYCVPCGEKQASRQAAITRTAGIDIGGAGIAEWQKTNNAMIATKKELAAWIAAYKAEAQKRADSKSFGGLCVKGGSLDECLNPNEREAVKWIVESWDPFFAKWNELVDKAKTGVPWGDDAELRQYQADLLKHRARFEELAVYRFLPIPAWAADRDLFAAIKESTGLDLPGSLSTVGLVAAGIGGLALLVTLTRK